MNGRTMILSRFALAATVAVALACGTAVVPEQTQVSVDPAERERAVVEVGHEGGRPASDAGRSPRRT